MKVKYVGFGGYGDYPCYEDENGGLYFDTNNGRDELALYTGAYRHPEDGDICGEPCCPINEPVECDEPFKRHKRERDYMMLSRYKSDCDYFLGNGGGYEGHLYYKEVNRHCDEMQVLYDSFSEEDKPEWLTATQIAQYRADMLALLNAKTSENFVSDERPVYCKKDGHRLIRLYFSMQTPYEIISTNAPNSLIMAQLVYTNEREVAGEHVASNYDIIKAMGFEVEIVENQDDSKYECIDDSLIDESFDYYDFYVSEEMR